MAGRVRDLPTSAHPFHPSHCNTTREPNCLFCKFASQIYHRSVLVAYQFVSGACKAVFEQLVSLQAAANSSHYVF